MTSLAKPPAVASATASEGAPVSPAPGPSRRSFAKRFASNRFALVGLLILVLLVLTAVFAPLLAPRDPNEQSLMLRLRPPGGEGGLLGTDDFGRDVLSRLIFGARVSIQAVAIALSFSLLLGVPLGLLAGFVGKWLDAVLNRVTDAILSVPGLILIFTIIAVLGQGLVNAMLAVGMLSVPRFYRVTRAATQDVRHETYIEASMALGCSTSRTVLRHVLPNILAPLVVQAAIAAGGIVTAEASLSFLGVGVKPPTASWGSMLATALQYLTSAPHLVWAPGAVVTVTVLAFVFVGDGLRSAMGTTRSALQDKS